MPELTAETQAALGELLPPLTYQRNPVDTGRPGPEFAGVLPRWPRIPAVDVVAAYALHEPDASTSPPPCDAGEAEVPLVVGVGGTGPEGRPRGRAAAQGGSRRADPTGVGDGAWLPCCPTRRPAPSNGSKVAILQRHGSMATLLR